MAKRERRLLLLLWMHYYYSVIERCNNIITHTEDYTMNLAASAGGCVKNKEHENTTTRKNHQIKDLFRIYLVTKNPKSINQSINNNQQSINGSISVDRLSYD